MDTINKWSPFNAVIAGDILTNQIQKEKNKISKPILSDEQLIQLENIIIKSFVNKIKIQLYLYQAGNIYQSTGIVTHINKSNKIITINNQKKIHFDTIIKVKTIDY